MITDDRRAILTELKRLSELAPDMRFGQLIANLSHLALGASDSAIWDVEDDQLLAAIQRLSHRLMERDAPLAPAEPAATH